MTVYPMPKVVITDSEFPNLECERSVFRDAGVDVALAHSKQPGHVIEAAHDADGLLVHWAPITRDVLTKLTRCRVIVRYGIGYDNIDIKAAADRGIAVCNVPDYASGEVADHTMALALAMARQVPLVDQRIREGIWKITPDFPLPAFRDMNFVSLGYGRIAREVIRRAHGFGFKLHAHDPFIPGPQMRQDGVKKVELAEALAMADILSLHLPLTDATRHTLNPASLGRMKKSALVVNTSRGALIDTVALAAAIRAGGIQGAAIDVFESEPLGLDHPLRTCPRVLLTSHIAWYSDASAPRLQTMAAEEVVRGIRGEQLRSKIN